MHKSLLVTPLAALALATSALASGSSPTRPPRPPRDLAPGSSTSAGNEMDDGRYALGKAVYIGKTRRVSNPSATKQQRARLNTLAARAGREGAALPNLAGQLSAEQLDALDYYVSKRFGGR